MRSPISFPVVSLALLVQQASCFSPSKPQPLSSIMLTQKPLVLCKASTKIITPSSLFMAPSDGQKYSTEVRLREEAEAPFRKVRFFVYSALLAGAFVSLLVSVTRIAAGLSGINVDLLPESELNAAVDAGGIVVLGFLLKSDVDAQESRLKRASKGAELAKLLVRGRTSLFGDAGGKDGAASETTTTTFPLSSLRAGRGIEKRVVICAAGVDKIAEVMEGVKSPSMQKSLANNDLLVVPVVTPEGTAPLGFDLASMEEDCTALPTGGNWAGVIADESAEARSQGVDVEADGICIILKKNGRVGQRTSGIFLNRMVGEVEERQGMGMDVQNI